VRVDAERNAWHNLTGVSPDIPAKRARTKLLADLEEQEIPSFSEENRKFSDWAFVLYRDSKDHEADLDDTESFVRQLLGLPFPRALIQEIITRHPSESNIKAQQSNITLELILVDYRLFRDFGSLSGG
jgi:hypothetical protein